MGVFKVPFIASISIGPFCVVTAADEEEGFFSVLRFLDIEPLTISLG
jgi:hypothetical protein